MHDCTNHAELLLYYEHSYIFRTERVFIAFDSLTRTTLKGSYIMDASRSGEESPDETNGPPKDMTTNDSPTTASNDTYPDTETVTFCQTGPERPYEFPVRFGRKLLFPCPERYRLMLCLYI